MRKFLCLGVIVFIAVISAPCAFALDFGTNITIPDLVSSGQKAWWGNREDNEVEPNCVASQSWDMEAFFLKGNTLTAVSGFNPVGGYENTLPGDIFIDVTGDITYGPAANGTGYYNHTVSNSFGYDYVISFSAGTYSVYSLDSDAQVKSVYYAQNQESNAWRYISGGEALEGFQNLSYEYLSGLTDEETGLMGGIHYALSVDLSFLAAGTIFTCHDTMQCGNDNLMGRGTTAPVPEPATIFIFGLGLVGLSSYMRRMK